MTEAAISPEKALASCSSAPPPILLPKACEEACEEPRADFQNKILTLGSMWDSDQPECVHHGP